MKFCLVAFLIVICSCVATAQSSGKSIYLVQDPEGKQVYSNKAPAGAAKPLELPEISKGEALVSGKPIESCYQHGGINCQAGADADGSVICQDGFPDAVARFKFSCTNARLKVSDIKYGEAVSELRVLVRNTSSVAAEQPKIKYRVGNRNVITLVGPELIDAFGVGEYSFPAEFVLNDKKIIKSNLSVDCLNCQ